MYKVLEDINTITVLYLKSRTIYMNRYPVLRAPERPDEKSTLSGARSKLVAPLSNFEPAVVHIDQKPLTE